MDYSYKHYLFITATRCPSIEMVSSIVYANFQIYLYRLTECMYVRMNGVVIHKQMSTCLLSYQRTMIISFNCAF